MSQATQETINPTAAIVEALVARMLTDVDQFNREVCALPIPATPTMLNESRAQWSRTALQEELDEFTKACNEGDILEAADGLLDMVFFALGRLVEMGIPPQAIWQGIAKANLAKERGQLSKRPGSLGHDAIKPEGWKAPDHSWLLGFSLADLEKVRMWDSMSPVLKKVVTLRAKKGQDYNAGPTLKDYFPFGHKSYAQMVHLKTVRIHSLLAVMEQGRQPNFEGLQDTLEDLINYTTFYAEALADGSLNAPAKDAA
jgi:predicted HAD superfamily Cof-like phosphohydrolase